jgi:hypothetical protein
MLIGSWSIKLARRALKQRLREPFGQLDTQLSRYNRNKQGPEKRREAHSMRQPWTVAKVIMRRGKDLRRCDFNSGKVVALGELEPGTAIYDNAGGERIDVHAENVGMVEQSTL